MTDDAASRPTVHNADTVSPACPGILVVDDDRILLNLLRAVFTRRGFQVWSAASGADAVETFRIVRDHIDVVLLDVCMPGLDGPGTLAELRQEARSVRVCFMSGYTSLYTVDDLLGMGALRFFAKPFQIEDLAAEMWQIATAARRQSA